MPEICSINLCVEKGGEGGLFLARAQILPPPLASFLTEEGLGCFCTHQVSKSNIYIHEGETVVSTLDFLFHQKEVDMIATFRYIQSKYL